MYLGGTLDIEPNDLSAIISKLSPWKKKYVFLYQPSLVHHLVILCVDALFS